MHKALLVWVCCTSFLFGQNTKEGQRVPLVGDETPLIKIKTDPHKYISDVRHHLELPIVMTGGIRLDNYYNYGYRDKQLVYYSYDFREFVTPTKLGDVLE